jgi:hypothetical protein
MWANGPSHNTIKQVPSNDSQGGGITWNQKLHMNVTSNLDNHIIKVMGLVTTTSNNFSQTSNDPCYTYDFVHKLWAC